MQRIERHYRPHPDHLALLEKLFTEPLAILDIETTGFSRTHAKIMLIGIIVKKGPELKSFQLFDETGTQERDLLTSLFDLLLTEPIATYITYNGHSFDFPFINARAAAHGIEHRLMNGFNVDLYRLIRNHVNVLGLENYKLKTVERYLGIERIDLISGKESIERYHTYLKSGEPDLREEILQHNLEDIEYLVPLIDIIKHLPEGALEAYIPVHLEVQDRHFVVVQPHIRGDYLHATVESALPSIGQIRLFAETFQLESLDRHRIRVQIATASHLVNGHLLTILNPLPLLGCDFATLDPKERRGLICSYDDQIQHTVVAKSLGQLLERHL